MWHILTITTSVLASSTLRGVNRIAPWLGVGLDNISTLFMGAANESTYIVCTTKGECVVIVVPVVRAVLARERNLVVGIVGRVCSHGRLKMRNSVGKRHLVAQV